CAGRSEGAGTPARCASADALFNALSFGPLPQQVVIDRRELDHRRMSRKLRAETLDRHVHLEKEPPLCVVADHALDPEERAQPHTASDGSHAMLTRRGIQNHVPCRELDALRPESVLDDELATV